MVSRHVVLGLVGKAAGQGCPLEIEQKRKFHTYFSAHYSPRQEINPLETQLVLGFKGLNIHKTKEKVRWEGRKYPTPDFEPTRPVLRQRTSVGRVTRTCIPTPGSGASRPQ